jgi:hypothetical protein
LNIETDDMQSKALYCRDHGGRDWDDAIPKLSGYEVPSDDEEEWWKTYTAGFKEFIRPEIGNASGRAVAGSDRGMDGTLARGREWMREERRRR